MAPAIPGPPFFLSVDMAGGHTVLSAPLRHRYAPCPFHPSVVKKYSTRQRSIVQLGKEVQLPALSTPSSSTAGKEFF